MSHHSRMTACIAGLTLSVASLGAFAAFSGEAETTALLSATGLQSTIVIETLDGHERYVFNEERAATRFCPASTFKVANTLIGLDFGAVSGNGVEFEWDGTDRGVDAWNRDQTLASAIRVSCVWCYQRVARQVGRESYEQTLAEIDYGNAVIGAEVDQFWLDGSLRISADEQIRFLRRLRQSPAPFSREQMAVLDDIMTIHTDAGYTLRAKTGWTGAGQHIGWYVGSLQSDTDTWLFAMNFDMYEADEASLRQSLTLDALRTLGILPADWRVPD